MPLRCCRGPVQRRYVNEFPGTSVGDGLKALSQNLLVNAPLLALDPEPGAVTITVSGGVNAASFGMGTTTYVFD